VRIIPNADSTRMFSTLISAAELAGHLDDPAWIIFDCRHDLADPGAEAHAYAAGHIPGARHLHLDHDLAGRTVGGNGRHPLPLRDAFVAMLRVAGVSNESQVVAYDAQGGIFASRLWWMLRWVGHEAVAVLDGGMNRWRRDRLPLSQAVPAPLPGNLEDRAGATSVDAAFVEARLGSLGWRLIDARNPERFRGENETLDPVGGHIPGSINRFFKDNLDNTGCFKSPAQLRADFLLVLGDTAGRDAVHTCGSGVTACHNLLAMEIAGLSGSRLYPGSWSEWCADPGRPVARG
jgi:thiosulfate/3-mercaptopyruvate sulfurtransferase